MAISGTKETGCCRSLIFAVAVAGGNAVQDVAAAGQAGDFVERFGVDRQATEADGRVLGEDVGGG